MQSRKRLFLIDGMSHIYRAFYAIPKLSNSKGLPTNAIYGFTTMLRKLIDDEKPDFIGVAFDLEGPTVRHEKFEAYKATRKPMPEDLSLQLPFIRRVCDVFRVPVISCPGYEADDVLGTLADKAAGSGLTAVLVTSDKDMLQLVGEHILVLDPMKDNMLLDHQKVLERFGVDPELVPDLLGLWGDSSDNIPGAPGIGEKGAKELVRTFGTVDSVLLNWEQVKRKTYRESLRDNADLIRLSRELAEIHRDLPLELDLDSLVLSPPDREAAFRLFAELEFKSLVAEFHAAEPQKMPAAVWQESGNEAALIQRLDRKAGIAVSLRLREDVRNRATAETVCVISPSTGPILLDLRKEEASGAWDRLVSDPSLTLICWDSKTLRLAQARRGTPVEAAVIDVMLMAFLTSPHLGDYSIHRWAMDQLQVSIPQQKGTESSGLLSETVRNEVGQALSLEAESVRRIHDLLGPLLESLGVRQLYDEVELPLVPVLADMEFVGVKVDPRVLRSLSSEMDEQLVGLTRRIYESAGGEFNINSPKQLGEILFEKLNLPMLKKTRKTKGYSTDQTVLEELAVSYELPRLILEYRQLTKLKSTYVDTLPSLIHPETGRVHTSYNQAGAATGRISSSDPNLQNIPVRTDLGRRIRGAFVPEAGNLLISADYSQIELRVLAHLSEDEGLIDAFLKNEDIHERTAREVFTEPQRKNQAECRRRAKVINFGIVYGLSSFGLAQRLGISREDAQAYINAYFERYKGVRVWIDRTVAQAREEGLVRTLLGRIRPIPDIHSRDYSVRQFAERTAVNTPIQGTAADLIKIAMIRIWKSLQEKNLSTKMLLQVHDELVLESPEREVDQVQHLVRQEMEAAVSLKVPLRVEMSLGNSWQEMK